MPAVFVVVQGVDESILLAIKRPTLIRKKELTAIMCRQHLGGKGRLFVHSQTRVKAAQLVISIHKSIVGGQQPNEGIFLSDAPLETHNTDSGMLSDQPR